MAGFGSSDSTFNHLQSLFNDNEEIQMRRFLRDFFDMNQHRVFSLALTLATQTRYLFKSKQKSIPEVLFNELREWLKTKSHLSPTQQNQDEAMFFLVSYGVMHLDVLKEIYQLDTGADRAFLAKHLSYLIRDKNELKDAAIIATTLNLQEYIPPVELLLPLFVADKFQVSEVFLKNSVEAQKGYADMLNMLCGMTEERLIQYIQCDLQLRIMDRTKFKTKTFQKICEKVVKKYQLEPAHYPNIFREKNLKSLRYLLTSKYKSLEYEFPKWDGLIEAAVAGNQWLQEQLVFMLTFDHRDLASAVKFARKFLIPSSVLPKTVNEELQRNANGSSQATVHRKPPVTFFDCPVSDDDDDYDDGFTFAADDGAACVHDYDYASDVTNSINSMKITQAPRKRFWEHPLPKGNIKFINTCGDLAQCMKIIFKAGNVIGFDGEWQPKYGRAGEPDKMAIMQLAVKDQVFIIDVLAFDQTVEGQNYLKELFKLLFTSENTLRLGYGIDSDISVITNAYRYTNEFVKKSKHFNDLAFISKQILSHPMVITRLQLDKTASQNERGLSQLVKQCLGKPLDKTYQVSNWELRPLSEEQLRYAALDALCVIKIYDVFEELAAEFKINVEMDSKRTDGNSYQQLQTYETIPNHPPRRPGELAVVCDTMLQGLGKSLRCFGVDSKILKNENSHGEAVQLCMQENRIMLSKGRPFFQFRSQVPESMCLSVPDGKVEQQVFNIFQRFNIKATCEDIFSRCQVCNSDHYIEIDCERMMVAFWKKKRVKPKALTLSSFQVNEMIQQNRDSQINFRYVTINGGINLQCEFIPLPVFEQVEVFYACAQCGKVYWQGSHYEKVTKQFSHVLSDVTTAGGMANGSSEIGVWE